MMPDAPLPSEEAREYADALRELAGFASAMAGQLSTQGYPVAGTEFFFYAAQKRVLAASVTYRCYITSNDQRPVRTDERVWNYDEERWEE
jgi:hypothetical protein